MQPLLAAVAALALAVVGHITALRLGARHLPAYGISLAVGICAVPAAVLLTNSGEPIGATAIAMMLFFSWWFVFLNFFQSSQSSLRVNILRQMARNGGAMDERLLFASYNDVNLISLRIARLTQSGAVVERGGRYFVVSPGLRFLAAFFRFLKILIMGRASEFH